MYNKHLNLKKGFNMKKLLGIACLGAFAFAANCTMCHNGGIAGKLDKLTPAQIEAKIKEMKKTGKGNPMMVPVAKKMSDKDIAAVAKEYGKK